MIFCDTQRKYEVREFSRRGTISTDWLKGAMSNKDEGENIRKRHNRACKMREMRVQEKTLAPRGG